MSGKKETIEDRIAMVEMISNLQAQINLIDDRLKDLEATKIYWPTPENIQAVKWLNSPNDATKDTDR